MKNLIVGLMLAASLIFGIFLCGKAWALESLNARYIAEYELDSDDGLNSEMIGGVAIGFPGLAKIRH